MQYLTEESLGHFLQTNLNFCQFQWHYDSIVPNSGIRLRPDYRCDELNLIVEFDGYLHYSNSKTIVNDSIKNDVYTKMGYEIVRIPYFVQLSTETLQILFGIHIDYEQTYPHGFIDKKALLPADFCEMGIDRFKKDLDRFSNIAPEIVESLKKLANSQDIRTVVPKILHYLL